MNQTKLDQFIALVSTVRNAQNQYWHNGRQKDDLNKSLALETRLDQYLASCKQQLASRPGYVPDKTAKTFFDLVDGWRTKFKSYFRYKKKRDADPDVCKEMSKECKAYEAQIDNVIRQYLNQK